MVISGKWDDGSPLTAVPNFARSNRVTQAAERTSPNSIVWIKKK